MEASFLNLGEHPGAELVRRVERAAVVFPETQVACRDADDGVAVRLRERDVRVVLGAHDVQVVWLGRCLLPKHGPLEPFLIELTPDDFAHVVGGFVRRF